MHKCFSLKSIKKFTVRGITRYLDFFMILTYNQKNYEF
ncbi:MAG TPA: hypothetical protein DHV15_05210 [Treponema sp.]|uniref:Uncharacterized protein n=1 Tax=Treponema denticola (strain ATCC 35405 / DSM 14222 / CIP 103919 / JCM 8153 / KCTC 15104) TaxID=243275 RepID=Q73MD4_TREDE|nr:hypothetical protein TDE_1574 [Treponema denticola ATCC 35405]HCY94899.1 hypothetical protein [Treponema sp.]